MKLFVFSSATHRNVEIAVMRRRWAVSLIGESDMKARFTKSEKMDIGSRGLLYSKERGQFTVPFVTKSQPISPADVTSDIWPEPWGLAFDIEPLGPSFRGENLKAAKDLWPFLKGLSNVTRKIPLGGSCAFASCQIADSDWDYIVKILGYRENEFRNLDQD
jgi:hypothetical protein